MKIKKQLLIGFFVCLSSLAFFSACGKNANTPLSELEKKSERIFRTMLPDYNINQQALDFVDIPAGKPDHTEDFNGVKTIAYTGMAHMKNGDLYPITISVEKDSHSDTKSLIQIVVPLNTAAQLNHVEITHGEN